MIQEMMTGPMSWGMGLICLFLLVVLALAAAALVKYIRS